ncbi:MAG: leucine-rich repeat protein [Enterocloster sp.]
MEILYKETLDGLCIQRCYGLDGIIQLPDEIGGRPVTELAGYVFSRTVRGREIPPAEYAGEPELCGAAVEELVLPEHIKKIGPYAFYNCSNLRSLSCWSTVRDWGAGVFTGCSQITKLDIRIREGEKSCFKEILSELRQTLEVCVRGEDGELRARLIFPEFFEESVENTPARIIMREMHGCGHMYRYCFDNTAFQYREYDALFPHVQVQEKPELVTRLALYRLYWPWGLTEQSKMIYREYLTAHAGEAAYALIKRGELDLLRFMAELPEISEFHFAEMIKAAAVLENAQASALLMDARHRRCGGQKTAARRERKRTFEL